MKHFFAVLGLATAFCAQAALTVDRVEPPYWWAGMNNDTVQVMLAGSGIGSATASVDYPGVKIIEDVEGVTDNYKILYLTIADNAVPGDMKIKLTPAQGKGTTVDFPLRARTWKGTDNPGFDASDVLYLIMPDRFADGNPSNNDIEMKYNYRYDRKNNNARHGGDVAGIRNNLPYIDSLGVTAVWVNPVLENDIHGGSYHGYSTTDYYNIDKRFGTNEEWREFVEDAHGRGIKVVMDMIFNHSGSTHPWMSDMPMADWYNHPDGKVMTNHRLVTIHDPYASEKDMDEVVNGWFTRGMPDLNQRNKHMMNYLIQNSIFWIEDSHIDGIRMDTYPYADLQEMGRWIAEVEREYPNFNIVGECWYPLESSEAFWQRNSAVNKVNPNLKTVMDFKYPLSGKKAFFEKTADRNGGFNIIYDHLAQDFIFPNTDFILTFLDNHDTDRFLDSIPTDLGSWRQAMAFLLTSRGIPQIYYGTEILMNGTRAKGGDGNVRRDMPGGFPGDEVSVLDFSGMTDQQREAFNYLSKLLHWRKGNDVIAKGKLKHFIPTKGQYIYERRLGDRAVQVILNGTDEPQNLIAERITEILPTGTVRRDVITGEEVTISPELVLEPRAVLILEDL